MNAPQILRAALARRSFSRFCQEVYPGGFEIAAHHALMISYLEKLIDGRIRRLMITTAPRHGKTTLGSILLPCYVLGRDPKREAVVAVSYGSELSESWGRKIKGIMSDGPFRNIFPGCVISGDSAAQYRFDILGGSSFVGTGRGGPLTGRGSSFLILDDLTKDAAEAQSPAIMKSVCEWLDQVAFTRLSPNARVLSIATRWSEKDPQSHLLQQGDWTVLNLPAFSEGEGDPLGRPIGAPLWPSRFPAEVLERTKRDIGSRAFQILYQQNPRAGAGNIFRREWFQLYNQRPQFDRIVQSWDCATKTGTGNDYSVGSVWGITSNGYYLLSLVRRRMEFVELRHTIAALADEWKPNVVLVEDAGAGSSAIQELKSSTTYPIIAVKADRSKIARAEAVTPTFESGRVYFPDGAFWLSELMDELCSFPTSQFDDQVDSCTQFLNYIRGEDSGDCGGVAEVGRRIAARIAAGLDIFRPIPKLRPQPIIHPPGRSVAAPSPAEDCPTCGFKTRIQIGSVGNVYRCCQCGTQFYVGGAIMSMPAPANGCRCEVPRPEARRPIPGGRDRWKCDDCGFESDATEGGRWPVNGMSRSDYQSGAYRRRGRWN